MSQSIIPLKWIFPALTAILFLAIPAMAADDSSVSSGGGDHYSLGDRAKNRESKRWTLQEWLETRDRNRMMDLWLTMNSPSPYEAMVGAAYKPYQLSGDPPIQSKSYVSSEGMAAAYAKFVGLGIEYENNVQENFNDVTGMFNLRVFGNSIQSTYLTFSYGQRTRTFTTGTINTDYRNQFGQADLQLYLMKYFGINGIYRAYLPVINDTSKQQLSGTVIEAGAFIDFKALRVFGAWFQDIETLKGTASPFTEATTTRIGTKAGIKIFF